MIDAAMTDPATGLTIPDACSCHGPGHCQVMGREVGRKCWEVCRSTQATLADCDVYRVPLLRHYLGVRPTAAENTATSKTLALKPEEIDELFAAEKHDPTLLGNRIAALTAAIGVPPCGGCEKRKAWLNKAHAWLRSVM